MPHSSIDQQGSVKQGAIWGPFSIEQLCAWGSAQSMAAVPIDDGMRDGASQPSSSGDSVAPAQPSTGDTSLQIHDLSRDFLASQSHQVTFLGDEVARPSGSSGTFLSTKAGACFVKPQDVDALPPHTHALITPRPYRSFIQVLRAIEAQKPSQFFTGISPHAYVHPSATIDPTCSVGHGAVIGAHVVIRARSTIGPNTVIESGVTIGSDTRIDAHVTIEHAMIGDHVQIQTGARVGHIGFGFVIDDLGFLEIPHQGKVIVHNHVHLGANTTISRGSFQNTEIGEHARIDALVQIAHNVIIGKYAVIVSQCGIAGSCVVGDGCFLGGQVGLANGIVLAAGTKIAAKSGVMRSIDKAESMAGIPAVPVQQWRRSVVLLNKSTKQKTPES